MVVVMYHKTNQLDRFKEPVRSSLALVSDLDEFSKALTRLQFEGKCSFARNAAAVRECLKLCRRDFLRHFSAQENIFFPFIDNHIPRFNSLTRYFSTEHRILVRLLEEMVSLQNKISQNHQPVSVKAVLLSEFRETAYQFIYLLRYHLKEELEKIYCELKNYLKRLEYRSLCERLDVLE